ncbi:MAG: 6-carboxytetrahydropterin synthase [Pseudomonadota bacterium]
MYKINKIFTFSYGHRLLNDPGKCSRLHGHTGKVKITLGSKTLNESGMVCHFDELKTKIGTWIETELDHTLLLNENDPLAKELSKMGEHLKTFEGNPTAEKIAEMIFYAVKDMGFPITKVKVWESETSNAVFSI